MTEIIIELGHSHEPSRLPVKKLRRLLHKRRKVGVFVWKGIWKNIISYYSSAFTINPQPRLRSVRSHSVLFVKADQNVYKPLTTAPGYILIKSFFLEIGWSYLHDLSHTFLKRLKILWGVKSASFSIDKSRTSRLSIFNRISNHTNFIPKHLLNALTDFV